MDRTLVQAIAYIDDQDPTSPGWAYRLRYDDRHEESGPLDSDADDRDAARSELQKMIDADDTADTETSIRWQITPSEGWYWSAV